MTQKPEKAFAVFVGYHHYCECQRSRSGVVPEESPEFDQSLRRFVGATSVLNVSPCSLSLAGRFYTINCPKLTTIGLMYKNQIPCVYGKEESSGF